VLPCAADFGAIAAQWLDDSGKAAACE
jgi:hypothetical protein